MELKSIKLKDCIFEVDARNTNLEVNNLLGVTINKVFIPSVANINGTDLSKYKIINKNQFVCGLMQVSRDEGVAIALYKNNNRAIVSPAYYVFEVISDIVLPEYLELIFCSSEFDREATFNAVGGVRGTLTWEDFCNMTISIPSLDEQKKFVNQINTLKERLRHIEQLQRKLMLCSQTMYKNILSMSDEVIKESILTNACTLIKSGVNPFDGEKKFLTTSDVLFDSINEKADMISYNNRPSRANMSPTEQSLWFAKMKNTKKYIFIKENKMNNFIFSTGFAGLKANDTFFYWLWCFMLSEEFETQKDALCNGTTQEAINEEGIRNIYISYPVDINLVNDFSNQVKPMFEYYQLLMKEKVILSQIIELYISKI